MESYESDNIVRADDVNESEASPERDFTRILQKWQTMEETGGGMPKSFGLVRKPVRPAGETIRPVTSTASYSMYSEPREDGDSTDGGLDDEEPLREVVREADTKEEDYLPPPSNTKNILAKFQSLEAEDEQMASTQKPAVKKVSTKAKIFTQ